MSKETVSDNEYFTIWFHPEKKIVHHHIKKFVFGDTLINMLMTGTGLMEKHKATKWLSDDRENPILRKEDAAWGEANWFPQTVKAGWRYWAIVQPQKVLGKMNMEALAKQYAQAGVTTRFFTDPDEALKWLESV